MRRSSTKASEAGLRQSRRRVYEETGIEIRVDQQEFDTLPQPLPQSLVLGAINYKAPASPIRLLRRIKLGHAAGGHVVPPESVEIVHPILTRREEGIEVLAYDYIEAFAEESGTLAEPTPPCDRYDVVTLCRNADLA
ncbi:hypothetical protein AAFG13_38175 [Bradyrhizobium sp. B124]|uniref:hypothetical protein n=1 Tax=Bradyrhizobium sp. B124 TaxID=3140245 RepID=UPI003183D876